MATGVGYDRICLTSINGY